MTAEVAVMNKTAIALACDSASTTLYGGRQKIVYSVNKLFTLSKYHPVGVMIYGNSQFMRMPWENIIKSYRRQLRQTSFETLKEYADSLVMFVKDASGRMFPDGHENKCHLDIVSNCLIDIRDDAIVRLEKEAGPPSDERIREVFLETIKEYCETWQRADDLVKVDDQITEFVNKQRDEIINRAKRTFGEDNLTDEALGQLQAISEYLITKDRFTDMSTGLVVAGFGEADNFPSVESYSLEFRLGDKLKIRHQEDKSGKIDYDSDAQIIAFAQEDVVGAFMEGIDGHYRSFLLVRMNTVLKELASAIISSTSSINDTDKEKVSQETNKTIDEQMKKLVAAIDRYQRGQHIDPIVTNIRTLPKDELAQIAESLVNITSFKRRVSTEAETVGGPIDVAVISKGDGFIWIRRKHYFKAEYNPQFFKNYYRE